MIYDTSAILKIYSGKAKVIGDIISIPAIVKYELMNGINLQIKKNGELNEKNKVLMEFLENVDIIPIDSETTEIASGIWAELRTKGKPIHDSDILIAATAIQMEDELITADHDFKEIKKASNGLAIKII